MIVNSYHKKIGEFKTAGNPIKMSNYKDEEKRGDIPDLDEHREKIIKEFCNLTAGAIKESLELGGIKSLISLPLVTRGQDYVFFEVRQTPLTATLAPFFNPFRNFFEHLIEIEL